MLIVGEKYFVDKTWMKNVLSYSARLAWSESAC